MTTRNLDEPRLARFEIEQYELHVGTVEVEATSAAQAIQRLFNGDGNPYIRSEFLGACDQVGMSLKDHPLLAEELRKLGVRITESIVPSIRSVRRLDDTED